MIKKQIHDPRSQRQGDEAELNFTAACHVRGWPQPTKATSYQDRIEHWDFKMSNGRTVEVKACKKRNRWDKNANADIIFVEFTGITGHKGWLYGKADMVAFEREDDFLLVDRVKLADLAEKLVDFKSWTERPELYKSFRRKTRPQEHVGLITTEDVLTLNPIILKKA